ncbi:MAG TPA: ABC transporter ATP-binding protein [Bacteroidetes bacterium]|nr:ABC transporter ATP-binding protein [Bacteroidota bacterium]
MIEAQNLTKVFEDGKRGPVVAVDHITFSVRKGEIFGLLGTNGAGKTTTLRMLATLLTPTEGTAEVAGFDVRRQPRQVRESIGFLTGDTKLYDRLTPREVLTYYARLYGLSRSEAAGRTEEIARLFGMDSFLTRKYGKLSTGQKQRVSIGRAVIHHPRLMIFDEPTAGLDPISARHIHQFIRACREEGRTVFFSTHYLREAEHLCDRLAVLHEGTIRAVGTLEEVLATTGAADLEEAFFALIDNASGVHPEDRAASAGE